MLSKFVVSITILSVALADYSTEINPSPEWGVWEGWGTSLAWWANVFGQRDDLADLFFSTKDVVLKETNQTLPGLGMNIARYNAGACSDNTYMNARMAASQYIPSWKQMEGFWLDWASSDPTSSSWDWSRDFNQLAMVKKAIARGANLIELFSNSPMWWMCNNHNPSGADDGTMDNLETWNQANHTLYLVEIAKYARANWNITFTSIEPFNEPASDWWRSSGTQEGCHFSQSSQPAAIGYLSEQMQGLDWTLLAASDENNYDLATSTWNSFDQTTKDQVSKVNVHGYAGTGGRRDLLYDAVKGKILWNSEYGESDPSGMTLATCLTMDFIYLHNTAWVYWQVLDGSNWGLINTDVGSQIIYTVNPKYYVLAQFTRHIRPGFTIINGGTDLNTVAAYDKTSKKLVIITTNAKTPQTITYNLDQFTITDGTVTRWVTNTEDGGDKYVRYQELAPPRSSFSCDFTANTIITFELEGVSLKTDVKEVSK